MDLGENNVDLLICYGKKKFPLGEFALKIDWRVGILCEWPSNGSELIENWRKILKLNKKQKSSFRLIHTPSYTLIILLSRSLDHWNGQSKSLHHIRPIPSDIIYIFSSFFFCSNKNTHLNGFYYHFHQKCNILTQDCWFGWSKWLNVIWVHRWQLFHEKRRNADLIFFLQNKIQCHRKDKPTILNGFYHNPIQIGRLSRFEW